MAKEVGDGLGLNLRALPLCDREQRLGRRFQSPPCNLCCCPRQIKTKQKRNQTKSTAGARFSSFFNRCMLSRGFQSPLCILQSSSFLGSSQRESFLKGALTAEQYSKSFQPLILQNGRRVKGSCVYQDMLQPHRQF